ncbi:expressed unknown protein [Seminavis robusta]|uniref:Uncharacterized protein n=1 Tax=Seminavis robusta TaxID=568900 RepID=A0A9N8ETQ8_9STRA|nr:expressed unknown protein [Seminavis robusta]|eukprot:Sro1603_g285280.1 n/a (149) ;mRNA; r:5538-5984
MTVMLSPLALNTAICNQHKKTHPPFLSIDRHFDIVSYIRNRMTMAKSLHFCALLVLLCSSQGTMGFQPIQPKQTVSPLQMEADNFVAPNSSPYENSDVPGLMLGWDWWDQPMDRERDPPSVWQRLKEGGNFQPPVKPNAYVSPYNWDN